MDASHPARDQRADQGDPAENDQEDPERGQEPASTGSTQVAVLDARSVPTVKEFKEVYSRPVAIDTMYSMYTQARAMEYRKAALEQMRREAGKVDREGRWEIPEEIRKRETRQDGEPQ